jgi:hypothetical protein
MCTVKHLFLVLALFAPALSSASSAPRGAATLERVVFVGASASAGYGNNLLPSTLFEKAILTEHRPVEALASPLFFLNPSGEGARQADRLIAMKPSLAIGVDYLFWFVYGTVSDEARMKLLESGLAQLERLDFPVAVGDIPDMSGADPRVLGPQQIPGPKSLEMVNRRIREWAKGRENVLILPLSAWMQEMRAGTVSLMISQGRSLRYPQDQWLQPDRLHPSKLGVILLCSRMGESLQAWTGVSRKQLYFDAEPPLKEFGLY